MGAGYRRSRIVSHLWKTTALTTLALGLSGVVAHADPDGLWQPQIRAIVGADNNGGNAALEGFIPIKQTAESVLFLDVRAKHDFKDASGQDIGLGIRRIVNPDLMLGGYAYINLENYDSTQFTAATLGVEAITPNFDAHVNVFVPIKGDSTDHSTSSTLSMVSNQLIERISVLDHRDYAAWGIEGEIGAQVPVNLPDKHSLRLDIGGYHFEDPHGDDGSVTGAKAGFEYTIGDVFGSGTELVFAGEVRNDNRDDTQFAGSVRLNIPFNPGHGSDKTAAIGAEPVYPVSEGLRKRVNERVRGDIGVRIQSQEINGGSTTRVAINAATNAAFGKFYFADGGLAGAGTLTDPTTLDDAVTKAGSGGFVVALGGNGNLTTAGVTLANGQTVIGGGESVTAKLSGGGTATFNLGGSDGTIQGTNVANNVITLGTGNTLNGITITGGANGIFGNNATGTTLTNVTVTGAGGNGAAFTGNSTNVKASGFTATGNGLDGLHIEDNGTYNFTGTTLLQGNHDDGLDISGQGTYTFATVNALDNTDRGITVQGTSIAGSFTTTGGTVSGNGGMAVFIDPITAHLVLDSISQTGGTSGVVLDHVSGSFTVNGSTTISNTTGPAIAISDSPAAIRFGDVAISAPGGDGISFAGVNAAVVAGNIVISGLGVGTGLDFSGSHTNFTAQSLNITGTGSAGSIGIDLSSPTSGGATIVITDGGAIAGVDTGVRFGIAGSLAHSANAEFSFGGGSIAGSTASLDARGLNQTLGHYAFGSTTFSGPQLFDVQNVIFVGATATGSGTGSSLLDLASIATADANTDGTAIFVLVNRGTAIDDTDGFSLSAGQTLASFGNGRTFSLGGIPVNVTGDNISHTGTISDAGGAATLTSSAGADTVTLASGTSLLDFNVSNANPGGGTGIHGNNVTGVTISGVSVSGAGLDGLLFEGASNVAANNVTSTGNGSDGLHIEGNGSYAFTDTTTLSDNGGNGLFISGDGTYAFQTLNASDNSGFGADFLSTTGTFSTSDGTISGNGAAGVVLLGANIDVTLTSLTQDGGLFGASFAGVSGNFAVSGATTVSNTLLGGLGIFDSTADFTFGTVDISDITAPGGVGIDVQNSGGAVTFGGPVTLTHIDSEGILATDNAGTLTFSGPVSMTDPGDGIWLEDNTGAVSFSGAVTIDQPFGSGIDVVGSNGIISFGDIHITGLCNCSTGLDLSGSTSTFTAATLDVSGSSGGSSIGIDLSGTNGGSVTIGGGIIAGVDTGVQMGTNGAAGTTANTAFSFGAAGGAVITGTTASLDMRGLLPGSGTYAFNTTVLNGPQLFDIANVVFVGAASTGVGDGSSVNDLINATAADALAAPANTIFVLVNNGAGNIDTDADGFTLADGQSIVSFANGASVSLGAPPANVTGTHVISGTQFQADPFGNGGATLNNSAGNTIDLANGNLVANLTASSSATAIDGTGIAGATINGVTVSSAATGVVLDSVTGTVTVDGLHIQNASQTGIALVNSSATVNFTGNTTIANAGNVGLFANDFDGTATFDDLDIIGGGIGVGIVAGSSGTLTFGAGSSIAGTSSNAFSITNSTPNVTYNGTISQTAAASAVRISNMTGGTATFGGKITASTGAANAINLTGNTGGTINFTGGLDLTTDGGYGFSAVNGGTLTVTGTNTVATGLGPDEKGILIGGTGMTIGAAGVNFASVNVDGSGGGASTGIVIENISAGSGNVTFGNVDLFRISGDAIRLTNIAGGTYSFNGTTKIDTTALGVSGFVVQNSAATVNVNNLVTTSVNAADVSLANNTGTIAIGGTITNSGTGNGVVVSGGSAAITVSANISSSATAPGTAVKVDGITGGSVAFSGSITSTGTGNLFAIGTSSTLTGGTISFSGSAMTATGGGGAVLTRLGAPGESAIFNATAPLSITNAIGNGLSVSNIAGGSSATFGAVTVSGAGGNGIDIGTFASSLTFGTTTVTLGSAANAAGINFAGTNANVTFGTTNVTMGAGANQTGIDFNGSSTTADFGVTAITGNGDLTSRGIDLSSTTGNKTITFQRGSSITNLGIGVELSSGGTTATSANANFTFGDGTSADGLQSSISATAVGAFTVNTVGLDPALGNYDFDDVGFTGSANLPSAVGGTIMVSQNGGVIAAGTYGLSAAVTTISVAAADALAGTQTFAFVGTVDLSGTPFTLDSGQSITGFGNNTAITVSGTLQPVNVQGNLGATGGNVTGNEGVVTGTADFLHLLGSNQVSNTAFNFNGASGSVFAIDQSAGGFNNAGGITIQGVTVSNVATGSTAFKVASLDSNLSILDNNINVAGTLLDANGGAGNITLTRGTLPNSATPGTLTGGGVSIANHTGGLITFSDEVTVGGNGVSLTNNAGSIITFEGLDITTNAATAFSASGGGTVSVSGNTITTGTGTALDLDGVTIAAAGINFDTISSNGAATGISLNDVNGGSLDLGAVDLQGITSRGIDISGTLGSALDFTSVTVGLAAANAVGFDLNGASLGTSNITAGDFDVDGGSFAGTIGIDMAGTTGTGTIQLGDTVNNNPAGQTSKIENVGYGVQFSSATNAKLVFGDGQGPAESTIATTGGQVIHATDSLPTNGDYNFNDVNFSGDTSNLSAVRVYYVTSGGTGDGSLANPGSYLGAQASTANVVVLIDQNVNGAQETIDLSGTAFNLDDGQVLLAFKSGDAAIDVSQLGVDTSGGASAAFHFTTVQNSPIVTAPGGIDTLRPILQTNNATSVINLATSGAGTITGGIQNLIIRNTGTGAGISGNASAASSFFVRDNDIAAGGRALDFITTGAPADTLLLSIDGNTLQSTGAALAASFAGQNIGPTSNSIAVRSFSGNTVTGGTGGGIAFNNVTFDSTGAGGTVSVGTLDVGTTGARVQGNGLAFTNTSGTLDLGTFTVASNGGTGLLVDTKGANTNFTLNSSGGSVDTTNGTAFNLDPLTVNMTVGSVTASGGASGIIFDGVAGTFTVTGATSITNTTGAGISAINANTGTFNFNTVAVNNTTGGGIGWASGTLNVGGLANIDTTSGTGITQSGGATGFNGGLTVDTTTGTAISGTGGAMTIAATGGAETVNSTGGQAISLSGVAATIALDSTSSGGGTNNVGLTNVTGTVGLGSGALSGATGTAFNVTGGNAVITYGGSVTKATAGNAVSIANRGGGSVTFGGPISANGVASGIAISGATAANTVSFNGAVNLGTSTTMTGTAVSIDNAGKASTVNFANLNILTNGTAGFSASNGGTVNVTTGAVNSTGAQAVNLNGIAAGVTFTSTTSTGGTNNVSLTTVSGSVGLGTGSLSGATGAAFLVTGGSVNATYAGNITQANNAAMVNVTGAHTGTLTFNTGTLSATNGTGLQFSNADGTYNFNGTTTLNGGTANINILTGSGGTFSFGTGTSITNPTGTAMNVSGSTANVTYSGNITQGGSGAMVNVSTHSVGTLTFQTGTLSASNGIGLQFSNADGTYNFNGTTTLNGGDAGIDIVTSSDGAFSFGAGTSITNPTGVGFNVNGGAGNITYAGTISKNNANNIVAIQNRTGGTTTLSGTLTATGATTNGILVNNNSGGTINFSGAGKSLTTGTNTAVNLANNTNATINFTGGGLVINTTSGTGFNATGGGTVTVQGSGNTITSTTGTALDVENTNIDSGNLVFQSISSNGGSANGIILVNTGTAAGNGGLHVTGTGSAGSGGTIANKSGADGSATQGTGIFLNGTKGVQLAWMQLNDFGNFAIRGNNVTDFTLDHSIISGDSGTSNSLSDGLASFANVGEDAIRLTNLLGSGSITNSNISGGYTNTIMVENNTGTLNRLTIDSSTIGGRSDNGTGMNDGINFQADAGSTAMNLTVSNSALTTARANLVAATGGVGTNMDVQLVGNTVTNNHPVTVSGGTAFDIASLGNVTFNVANNTFDMHAANGGTGIKSHVIEVNKGSGSGNSIFDGTISGNTIGVAGTAHSGSGIGSNDIDINSQDNGTFTVAILNNILTHYDTAGIQISQISGSSTINATVQGNTTSNGDSNAFTGLYVVAGSGLAGDNGVINLLVGGSGTQRNDFSNGDPANGSDVFLAVSGGASTSTINLSRGVSAAPTAEQVVTDNNLNPATTTVATSGTINIVNTVPPLP
ncbi:MULTISPECIES: S-layer family protein [unclassified Mesorhizobium]|uniref:beta strand repeat-containing protein n=1 Tax=unclassified Mesorhizobium TaxID=325217 RepID=UPI0015CA12B5|nr:MULTISPECIES: S-layer family protein [unclassified Mesorhizobium]